MIVTSCDVILCTFAAISLPCCIRMSTDVSDSSMSDSLQSCHEPSEASEEELEVVTEFQPYSDEPLADDDAECSSIPLKLTHSIVERVLIFNR